MKLMNITLAGTALLALAACGQLGMGDNANNSAANVADNIAVTNEAAPPADANAAKPADAAGNEAMPTADPAAAGGDKPADATGEQPEPAAGDKPE